MQSRMANPAMVLPHAMEAIQGLYKAMSTTEQPRPSGASAAVPCSRITGHAPLSSRLSRIGQVRGAVLPFMRE
ncbi:hypothetical protein [Parafrankia sp. BMG5.11]|uniref:hypothetical protein n=1 Tax=Parafrankia sp. BMG5.11 TaxID=222540 RepID=UPI000DA4C3DC|nr:hypothetical protein [Parafrankia sp. BMG5.11]SQD99307.1 hypothetical protein FMEAI12_5210019 [Parafrankia sp. Ea1.12]